MVIFPLPKRRQRRLEIGCFEVCDTKNGKMTKMILNLQAILADQIRNRRVFQKYSKKYLLICFSIMDIKQSTQVLVNKDGSQDERFAYVKNIFQNSH